MNLAGPVMLTSFPPSCFGYRNFAELPLGNRLMTEGIYLLQSRGNRPKTFLCVCIFILTSMCIFFNIEDGRNV